jgi:polyisoprenoid-binding protein YceI
MNRFLTSLAIAATLAVPAFAQNAPSPSPDVSSAPAGVYTIDKSHARLTFKVSHAGTSMYQGRFNDVDATINLDPRMPQASAVNATIHIESVDTKNAKLEDELRSDKFMNTPKFPTATFVSRQITKTGATSGTMTGDLTFMGVTKPITMNVTFYGWQVNPFSKKETLGFNATATIKRSEWGFTTYVPMIGDTVQIEFDAEFNYTGGAAANAVAPSPTAPVSPAVTPPEGTPAPSASNKSLPSSLDKEPTAGAPSAPTVAPKK